MECKMLSIVVLFCDKDYEFIPGLLEQFDKRVCCDFEVILVDNRELKRHIGIPEINEFYKHHKGMYITKGYNMCQLAAKKFAVQYVNGTYVWFVDGDDELVDTPSDIIFDKCFADIIMFNYTFDNRRTNVKVFQKSFTEYKYNKKVKTFRNIPYLEKSCVTCWNKWFKVDLIRGILSTVPDNIKVSCNEDVYISTVALNRAKDIQEFPLFIYNNRPDRGTSNNKITTIERFKMVIQGWEESFKLFEAEFPKNTALFNREKKYFDDMAFFFNRVCCSEPYLWEEEMKIISGMFPRMDLIELVGIYDYYGFLNTKEPGMDEIVKNFKNFTNNYFLQEVN